MRTPALLLLLSAHVAHALRPAPLAPLQTRGRARIVLQQAPEPPAEAEAEAEAAEAAEAASSSSAPSELSYIEEQKQKFSGKSADVAPRTEVTIATPAFFGKREEERPGDARGQGGLNEPQAGLKGNEAGLSRSRQGSGSASLS